jgi:phage tail tape-measure protein
MNERKHSDRDLERNEDPETMAGAVGGATGAGFGAAVGMAALGPVGVVVGALAGIAGGWWAGRGIEQAVEDVDRSDNAFRRAHEHARATRPYEETRHAYQLGFLAGRNPDHADGDFSTVEKDLRAAWVQAHVHDERPVPWEDVRGAARDGFELARRRDTDAVEPGPDRPDSMR